MTQSRCDGGGALRIKRGGIWFAINRSGSGDAEEDGDGPDRPTDRDRRALLIRMHRRSGEGSAAD